MDPNRTEPSGAPAPASLHTRRHQWWLAALLLALTTAAGIAARIDAAPRPPADPRTIRFAPGGGGPVDLGARLDREAVMAGADGSVKMELVLRGHEVEGREPVRTPTDLVVVLDRSGSMQGEAMAHARAAARELMARLGGADRFALVSYANDARVDIPLARADGEGTRVWGVRLGEIEARGGTNMARGLDLAVEIAADAREAGRSTRVILISDGHANQGDHSVEGLRGRAGRAVAGEFVLTTVGVGEGFDESLMTRLADAGTGNFYFVRDVEALASVFNDEFLSARETVARALTLEIEPGAGVTVVDAAGYPLEHRDRAVIVRPGALFAGQERRLWLSLDVDPERRSEAGSAIDLARVSLHYREIDDTPHTLSLAEAPRVTVVERREEFFAAMDGRAYVEQLASDGLGSLRQQVAEAVQDGDRVRARSLLGSFERRNAPLLEGLGYDAEENESMQELKRMHDEVDAALAPSAPAGAANSLGKSLSSKGYDQRRAGAKRSQ